MRLGFLINDYATEKPEYTTIEIALAASHAGHEVWFITPEDWAYDPDESIRARARRGPDHADSGEDYLHALREDPEAQKRILVNDLDALMLRNNPAEDEDRPWAQMIGITFGRFAVQHGVIVLNDPDGLERAVNKMHFQHYPEALRPKTLITREVDEIKRFVDTYGKTILKPLCGSHGRNVFMIDDHSATNLNQIVEAIERDGYVVAQEYLPAAAEGDIRLFMMNGKPLEQNGQYAAFRRVAGEGDVRSNIHAGGRWEAVTIGERELAMAEMVRPKLVQEGMFLVGLDIAGDKLMEINVFTAGGFRPCRELYGINFSTQVLAAIESKIRHVNNYPGRFSNSALATL